MRPVSRGNPATYNADTPRVTDAIKAARLTLEKVLVLRNEIEDVDGAMTELHKFKKARKQDIENVTNADITSLERSAISLRAAFQQARALNNEDTMNSTGATLLTNLYRQSNLYEGFIELRDVNAIGPIYSKSRGDLIANIGQYCSYCEMPLAASLAVEHMLPKADFPELAVNWSNFLLACPICNSKKNKKPSLGAATIQAQQLYNTKNASLDQVIDAGYSLMLWPSDAAVRYTGFTACFQYVMRKVDYGLNSFEYNVKILSPDEINRRLGESTIFLGDETGDDIEARFYDRQHLGDIDDTAVIQYLRGLANPSNDPQGLPADVKGALKALDIDFNDHKSVFSLEKGSAYPQDTLGLEAWTLIERRHCTIATGQIKVNITYANSPNFTDKTDNTDIASLQVNGALRLGVFPARLAEYWGLHTFDWTFLSKRGAFMNEFDVTLERRFELLAISDSCLDMYLVSTAVVELLIQPVYQRDGALQKAIDYTVDYAGLNSRESGDLKVSDRRVIKRTRAWFTAVHTIRRVIEALNMGSPTRENVLTAARHTIIATGFWTVWYSLVVQALPDRDPARAALLALLSNVTNFAGTRLNTEKV